MKLSKTVAILDEIADGIAGHVEPSRFSKEMDEKQRLIESIKARATTEHHVDRHGSRRTEWRGRHLETMGVEELRDVYREVKNESFAAMYGSRGLSPSVMLGNHGQRLAKSFEDVGRAAQRAEASFRALGGVLPGDPTFESGLLSVNEARARLGLDPMPTISGTLNVELTEEQIAQILALNEKK